MARRNDRLGHRRRRHQRVYLNRTTATSLAGIALTAAVSFTLNEFNATPCARAGARQR